MLDTNVVSELMRPQPDPSVLRWVDEQRSAELHLTAVTLAELLYGVGRLADGQRKSSLAEMVARLVAEDFDHRVLSFDAEAAAHYADIVVRRQRSGRPIGVADAQIAATCRSHGALLATRNGGDFEDTGVTLSNPWLG